MATVVDDSVVAYDKREQYDDFLTFLRSKLPITECPLEVICGMKVVKAPDGSISIDQSEYIEKKAKAFNCLGGGRRVFSPMDQRFELTEFRPTVPDTKLVSYARELMGSLIYATLTRPDCKYACSKLASVVTNPTSDEISAMERVLKYMYATRNTALTFRPGPWTGPDGTVHEPLEMAVYVDASFAPSEGRKSQTGFAILLAGAAILAKSGKQTQVTDSTGYSEAIALHECANWVIVVRNQLKLMFSEKTRPAVFERPTRIHEDNSAAVTFAQKGPGPRSLHWDVKLQYVRELQTVFKVIEVVPIATDLQIADVLTKALGIDQHLRLSELLMGGPIVFTG